MAQSDPVIAFMGQAQTPQQIAAKGSPSSVPSDLLAFNSKMVGNTTTAAPVAPKTPPAAASGASPASTPVTPTQTPQTNAQGVNIGAAPAGSKQSSNGNWIGSNGQQYTQPPAADLASNPSAAAGTPYATSGVQSESDIYNQYLGQSQALIDSINQQYDAQVTAANVQGAQNESAQNAMAAASGLLGSSAALSGAERTSTQTSQQIQSINAQRASAIASVYSQIQKAAIAQQNTETQNAMSTRQMTDTELQQQRVNNIQDLTTAVQGLARNGVSLTALQSSTDPTNQASYQSLLKLAGGDPNTLAAYWALNTPNANIQQQWVDGSTVYQLVVDPLTGKASVQHFDVGTNVPPGWQAQKIGTNGLLMYNPQDMSQQIIYSMDAFGNVQTQTPGSGPTPVGGGTTGSTVGSQTGAAGASGITDSGVKASDGGTFANFPSPADAYNYAGTLITQIANGQNSQYGSSPTLESFANTWTNTSGSAANNIASTLGVSPQSPLSDVISKVGMTPLLDALVKNEGGSYKGVQNNPFNIKYSGATGSGGDTTAANMQQYGKLSQVQGFNPGPTNGAKTESQQVDTAAAKYLTDYLSGKMDTTAASVGLSTRQGSAAELNTITQRAQELYQQATGQPLPDFSQLTGTNGLIPTLNKNQALLNNLNVQEGIISRNFGLSLSGMTASNINESVPAINGIVDFLAQQSGSPSMAAYLDSNATIKNEIASLFSIKNASGTTVADKLAANDFLSNNLSLGQQKAIIGRIMQEATNQRAAIVAANQQIYDQTDQLGINPQNPANKPGYQEAVSTGATPLGDGQYAAPDGTVFTISADGNVQPVQ